MRAYRGWAMTEAARGADASRLGCISPQTTVADVEALLSEVEACGAEAWGRMRG